MFVMLSIALMLLLLFITVLTFSIVWRCAYGFCTITVDSVSLCHVFSILLGNNGILLVIRTGYFGMM